MGDASALEHPFATLDVSLDAHVIPGRGKRVDCLLPVVCAAQEDTIEALVTSVVCQRYVWKMSSPVVGISLSNRSTIARIVIGWAEVPEGGEDKDAVVIVCFEICIEANKGGDDSLAYDTPGIRKREWQYPSSSWSIRHPRSSQCTLLRAVYSWTSFVLFFDQTGQSAAGHKRFLLATGPRRLRSLAAS